MLKLNNIIALLLVVPVLMLSACQPAEDTATDDMAADTAQANIEDFRSDLQSELQQIDQNLNEVEQDLAQATDEASQELQEKISDLKQERQEIDQRLQSLGQDAQENWQELRSDLRRRVDALAVDVSRTRMKAADTAEEFKSIAQEELQEIESQMNEYNSEPARGASDMANDEPMPSADEGTDDQVATMKGTGTEIQEWQQERDQLAQDLEQLETGAEAEFEEQKDELADAIADLNAEVRQASARMLEGDTFVQSQPQY